MEQSTRELTESETRFARWIMAIAGAGTAAVGVWLIVRAGGHDDTLKISGGGLVLLLGFAIVLVATRADWGTPTEEELDRRRKRARRLAWLRHAGDGVELALLLLALLGVLLPDAFGSYWRDHRAMVVIVAAGLVADLSSRTARWWTGRRIR